MSLRMSSIPLRHFCRKLHSQNISRTVSSVNRIIFNSQSRGAISKRFMNVRYWSSEALPKDQPKRITIRFRKSNGVLIERHGFVGTTLNELIPQNDPDIPGFGVCGGTLSCSTCHLIFEIEDYRKPAEKRSDDEMDLLDYAPGRCETSRLSCCVKLTEDMDGIILKVPLITKDQREEFSSR